MGDKDSDIADTFAAGTCFVTMDELEGAIARYRALLEARHRGELPLIESSAHDEPETCDELL